MKKESLFRKSIEVKTYTDIEEYEMKKIIIANYNLPVYEIKKKVKQKFSRITNEDIERLVCEISAAKRSNVNLKERQYQNQDRDSK